MGWSIFQCAVACIAGSAFFLWAHDLENQMARTVAAFAIGYGTSWVITFLIVWMRHGWRAARGMSLEP